MIIASELIACFILLVCWFGFFFWLRFLDFIVDFLKRKFF